MRSIRAVAVVVFSIALAPLAAAQGWLDTARWYAPSPQAEFHYIADFDGDGFDDLVRFDGTGGTNPDWASFRVWSNDGEGDLSAVGPTVTLPVSANLFQTVDGLGLRRLRDVTGDGRPDVLVVEGLPDFSKDVALHVYPSLGGGAFGAPIAIPLVDNLDAIALGQTDGDPEFELAILEEVGFSESTHWFDWNGASFTASAEALFGGGIGGAVAAGMVALDLDGDGDDDLVFGQALGQAPSGNLKRMDTVNGSPVVGASYPINLGSGHAMVPFVVDLDGGGAQDLLVVESVLGGFEFWLVPVLHVGTELVVGPRQHFTSSNTVYGQSFEPCDWDGDGDTDLLSFAWQEPGTSVDAVLAMFRNDGNDNFGAGPVAKADLMYAGPQIGLGVTDLDHDGHLDYIGPQTAYFGRSRFENSLTPITSFFFGADPRMVRDIEGDGDVDYLYAAGGARLNDGTGAFPGLMGIPALPPGKLSPGCTAIGDLTGDGLADFIQTWQNPPIDIFHPASFAESRLIVDDGLGHYVDGGTASTSEIRPFARTTSLVADFDGDGDNDVWGNTNGFWQNDGSGHLPTFVSQGRGLVDACAAGDVDGDTDIDLVGTSWPDQLVLLERTGPASYALAVIHEDVSTIDADSVTLADHDGDGDLDLSATPSWSDSLLLFANDGAGHFTPSATLSTDVSAGADPPLAYHAFADVDGDGIRDLLAGPKAPAANAFPNKVALFRGLSGSGYEPVRWYVGAGIGGVGDADGDGDIDLLGRSVVRSRVFDGPGDGAIRQYGSGSPGAGGAVPVLGASGPLRPGSTTATLRLRRTLGGVPVLLLYGLTGAALPNAPFQGSTLYVQPPFLSLLLFAGGPAGAPGKGGFTFGLGPGLAAAVGLSIYHQAAVFEPGTPKIKLVSNGLQLTYGM